MIGAVDAWSSGVAPFLVGAVVKSVAAVVFIQLVERALAPRAT
jgi:biotin transporter BioY